MHIVYTVNTCSSRVYRELFAHTKTKPAFQSQKYHRLLIEGLAKNAEVDVVACPPVNVKSLDRAYVPLPDEEEGGARYHYIPAIRNPYLKIAAMAWGSFWGTLRLARRDSAVMVDCLNRTTALFALAAARIRGCRCVGIVMDLPDMFIRKNFSTRVANFVIRHCTDYVLLTEAMNDYLRNTEKPYVVLEGHSDIEMRKEIPSRERKLPGKVCLYAGGVSRQYGLATLAEGFQKADIPDARLHIYGPGDYVEELKEIAARDSRIHYGGMLLNTEIVEKEMEATLLINPRPTHEEFVKYSFPSKTMEYMSTGRPVLTTKLPGMPREYYPHVFFIEEETVDGVADALKRVFSHSDDELEAKGLAARTFVLEERNNVIQAAKIIAMLENRE